MKRISVVLFVAVAVIVCIFAVGKNSFLQKRDLAVGAKLIVPVEETAAVDDIAASSTHSNMSVSLLVPLKPDETLIRTYTADFNSDTYDDQIIAVKITGSPYIVLVVGLYDPITSMYERKAEIATEISQVNTFSYTVMDITGERSVALIYSGFTEAGDSVLVVLARDMAEKGFALKKLADLKSDSSIFIQQVYRSEKYAMSLENGDSFPIWLYKTDTSRGGDSYDQLQIMYNWDHDAGVYTAVSEKRVAGKKIEAKELARIQDGTVKTFVSFLDGLWYKVAGSRRDVQYLFFNPDEKEIIFLAGSTQEVYTWQNSILRRNGIYLSTVNKSISNLIRRLDITLISSDGIRIKLNDDLRMVIGEETLWDGQYKKMQSKTLPEADSQAADKASADALLQTDTEPWRTQDGFSVLFEKGQYSVRSSDISFSGAYTFVNAADTVLIQFRPESERNSFLNGFYRIRTLAADTAAESEIVELIPYTVTASGSAAAGLPAVRLERIVPSSGS